MEIGVLNYTEKIEEFEDIDITDTNIEDVLGHGKYDTKKVKNINKKCNGYDNVFGEKFSHNYQNIIHEISKFDKNNLTTSNYYNLKCNRYDKYNWSKKTEDYIDNLNDPNIISIARQIFWKKINKYYFQYNSIEYNLLDTLKYNDNLFEVMDKIKTNIYYKFVLDIDNINEDGNDMIDVVKNIIDDTLNYFIEIYNIYMDRKQIFISSSCGWETEKVYKVSYHIVFSAIMLWKDYIQLFDDIELKIYSKYNLKHGNKFIDNTMKKSKKNLRILYQSKKNGHLIKKPLYLDDILGYSDKIEDHLVGCYGNTKERYKILTYNDDKFKEIRKSIEDNKIDIIKLNVNDYYISNHKLQKRQLLDYDFTKCLLFNIYNDVKIISYDRWYEIITWIYSYATSISETEFKNHSSNTYSILYKKREEYYLSLCIEWTLTGYKKDVENNFIKHHINTIHNIWNYLNYKNHDNKYIQVNNKAFTKLLRFSSVYNKHIVQKWEVHNVIPRNINLENQQIFNLKRYPSFGDKSVYELINKNNPFIALLAFMGLGKTEHIINMIIKYPYKRILILTPRETLTNAHYSRFNNALPSDMKFVRYKRKSKIIDKYSFGDQDLTKNFICSYESAWKLPNNSKYDIIILDEIEALSSSMLSSTSKTNGLFIERFRSFFTLIYNCVNNNGNIIFAEAMNSLTNICLMRNLLKDNQQILTLKTDEIRFYQKYILYSHHKSRFSTYVCGHFTKELFKDLKNGKRITAEVLNKNFLIDIKDKCNVLNIKCLIIHADNKNEMEKYINDPSLIEKENIQFLGWTSSVSVGFSEEAKNYWDFKYMFISNFGKIIKSCVSANTILQSNFRSRYVKQFYNHHYFIEDDDYNNNDENDILSENGFYNDYINQEYEDYINNDIIYDEDIYIEDEKDNIKGQITKVFISDLINDKHNLTLNNNYLSKLTEETFIIDEKHQRILTDKYNTNKYDYINIQNIIKYEDNVKNNVMTRKVLTIDDEACYIYNNIDNDAITHYVKINDYNRYESSGLLFNENEMRIIKELIVNEEIKSTMSKKYIADTLKCMVEKYGFIWDDTNVTRTYKKDKTTEDNFKNIDDDDKKNGESKGDGAHGALLEEVKNDNQMSSLIFPLEISKYVIQFLKDLIINDVKLYDIKSKKNSYGDTFYGDDNDKVKKCLDMINVILKYTNIDNSKIETVYEKNSLEHWGSIMKMFYYNDELFILLKTLKEYYHNNSYKNNKIDNDVMTITNNTIDKIFCILNVSNGNQNNLLDATITSLIINENETKINEMYNDYVIKNQLKGLRKDRVNKPISKLIFLLENILYITLDKGEKKSVRNKELEKVITHFEYKLIPLKIKNKLDSEDLIPTDAVYNIFTTSKRDYKEYTQWFNDNTEYNKDSIDENIDDDNTNDKHIEDVNKIIRFYNKEAEIEKIKLDLINKPLQEAKAEADASEAKLKADKKEQAHNKKEQVYNKKVAKMKADINNAIGNEEVKLKAETKYKEYRRKYNKSKINASKSLEAKLKPLTPRSPMTTQEKIYNYLPIDLVTNMVEADYFNQIYRQTLTCQYINKRNILREYKRNCKSSINNEDDNDIDDDNENVNTVVNANINDNDIINNALLFDERTKHSQNKRNQILNV